MIRGSHSKFLASPLNGLEMSYSTDFKSKYNYFYITINNIILHLSVTRGGGRKRTLDLANIFCTITGRVPRPVCSSWTLYIFCCTVQYCHPAVLYSTVLQHCTLCELRSASLMFACTFRDNCASFDQAEPQPAAVAVRTTTLH